MNLSGKMWNVKITWFDLLNLLSNALPIIVLILKFQSKETADFEM